MRDRKPDAVNTGMDNARCTAAILVWTRQRCRRRQVPTQYAAVRVIIEFSRTANRYRDTEFLHFLLQRAAIPRSQHIRRYGQPRNTRLKCTDIVFLI